MQELHIGLHAADAAAVVIDGGHQHSPGLAAGGARRQVPGRGRHVVGITRRGMTGKREIAFEAPGMRAFGEADAGGILG